MLFPLSFQMCDRNLLMGLVLILIDFVRAWIPRRILLNLMTSNAWNLKNLNCFCTWFSSVSFPQIWSFLQSFGLAFYRLHGLLMYFYVNIFPLFPLTEPINHPSVTNFVIFVISRSIWWANWTLRKYELINFENKYFISYKNSRLWTYVQSDHQAVKNHEKKCFVGSWTLVRIALCHDK